MKYVIFESPNGFEVPIIFPSLFQHFEIADKFKCYKPISGGEIDVTEKGEIITFGTALTIKKCFRKKDNWIIKSCFNIDR